MEQDKNFTIRLKAAIEKKLREHGIFKHGAWPPSIGEEPTKEWKFIKSLEDITLDQLQGVKQ